MPLTLKGSVENQKDIFIFSLIYFTLTGKIKG